MNNTNENYFDLSFNEYEDTFELSKKNSFFKRNRIMCIFFVVTIVSTIANLFLIHKFFEVLFSGI